MNVELRKVLEAVCCQVTEATDGYEWDDQSEFFGELADWAYGRHELLSVSPDPEIQDCEDGYDD